jgi:integrase
MRNPIASKLIETASMPFDISNQCLANDACKNFVMPDSELLALGIKDNLSLIVSPPLLEKGPASVPRRKSRPQMTERKNASTKWKKILATGELTLFQSREQANLWQVRLPKPNLNIRRQLLANTQQEALEKGKEKLGLKINSDQLQCFTLLEAFNMALSSTNRGKKAELDWRRAITRFLLWLQKNYPACTKWSLLRRPILREYLESMAEKSDNTKRLYLQPIVQTSGFMHREYDCAELAEKLRTGSKLKAPPKEVYLPDVADFCDYLAKNAPWLEGGVALQGLAGLAVMEALRLTWDRVNIEQGYIEVSGEVKNEHRERVIPICSRALKALQRIQTLDPKTSHVVVGKQGQPYSDYSCYSHRVRQSLTNWNASIDWAPKDLRNCLPTFFADRGLANQLTEEYIGHSLPGITARHYVPRISTRSRGEFEALTRKIEAYRQQVVQPLEAGLLSLKPAER